MSWRCPAVKHKRKGFPNPSTVTWILHEKPPRLRPSACSALFLCPSRTGMGTDNWTTHHPVFHVRVVREIVQHSLPHAVLTPAGQAFVHTYSSWRIQVAANAIVPHSGLPRGWLRRNDGIRPRFLHKHSGLVSN